MSEITVRKKTFHQYMILNEIKIPKKDILKEFGTIDEFLLQIPFREKKTENFLKKYKIILTKKDYYTENTNQGFSVEYDLFDEDKPIFVNNIGFNK